MKKCKLLRHKLPMVLMATVSSAAQAQPTSPSKNPSLPAIQLPSALKSAAGGVEEVVVTARKRSETLQDVPVAVVAFSAAQLKRYDLSSLERVAAVTPNFTIARASNGSGAQLTLRGIGSNFTSIGIEQSVATVVDGVYYGLGRVINEGLFDLKDLEILKGPQALFFGKNATAGVISIATADPTPDFQLLARTGYEFNAQQAIGELVVSGPLTDTLGLRLAVKGSNMSDGYVRNVAGPVTYSSFDVATGASETFTARPAVSSGPHEKELLGRVTLKWTPTSHFTATLKASNDNNRNENPSWNYVLFDCSSATPPFVAGSPCGRHYVTAQNALPMELAKNYPYFPSDGGLLNDYRSLNTTANLVYQTDRVSITSVTNYQQNRNSFALDGDYFSSDSTNLWTSESDRYHAFSSELRTLTKLNSYISFLLGGYYQQTDLHIQNFVTLGGVEDSSQSPTDRYLAFSKDSSTRGETEAAFGQVTLKVLPKVEINAGLRYTNETKKSVFVQPYVNSALQGVFVEGNPFGRDQTFSNISPEATIAYRPFSSINTYLSYKTGYKSGGFSNTAIASAFGSQNSFAFRPERAKGFEGGIKATTLNRQVRLDLALYDYTYSDLQVDFFNSSTISFVTTNAGSARTKGIELSGEFAPRLVNNLDFHGSINFDRARYINFIAPCYQGATTSQCLSAPSGVFPTQNLAGDPTSNAPNLTGSMGVDYEHSVGNGLRLGVSVDGRYSSRYYATAFFNPIDVQPSYINLDSSIRLRTTDDRWELALIGRNITNNFVLNGAFDAAGTGGPRIPATQIGLAGLPRTVQAQLTFRY